MSIPMPIIYVLVFYFLIFIAGRLLRLRNKNIQAYPGVLYFKTLRFNKWVETAAKKRPTFSKIFWSMGIVEAAGLMAYALYYLGNNLHSFYYRPETAGPVLPIIPGVTIALRWLPHIFIAISIAVLSHELAHGLAASRENIRLKSFGLFFVFFMIGAFTEIEEEDLKKARPISKLRTYGAGSSANFLVALLALLLVSQQPIFTAAISPLYAPPSGVLVAKTLAGSPIEQVGIAPNDAIYAINDTQIFSVAKLQNYMHEIKPGTTLVLSVIHENQTKEQVVIQAAENPQNQSRAFIGIAEGFDYYAPRLSFAPILGPLHTYQFLTWLLIISLSLAMINMLPMYPCDGQGFITTLLERYTKSTAKIDTVKYATTALCLVLIAANMALSLLRFIL